ncbi:MAG TPA: hypothetical protein VK121_00450 [Pseudogracilibacillus sp.]|nr:hypothetical protein [Pseudogracilibacillus sp.]
MVQANTGKFLIIFANVLITTVSLGFAYVAFILARINDTIGTSEFIIMTASILTVMISWFIVFLYFKKGIKKLLFFFFLAGLISVALIFFGQGLSTLIPGFLYLTGSLLIYFSKKDITDQSHVVPLYDNWKLIFIFIANILNTFIWVFFCYIFLLLIGNRDLVAQLLNTNFNESFTVFLIVSTLIFIILNWIIYYTIKYKDLQKIYFYFLIVSILNISIGIYNIVILNGGSFPPPEALIGFLIQAPVFLFLFPGILYIVGFTMREKEIVYPDKQHK